MAKRAGRLRKRLDIQSFSVTQSTFGEDVEAWSTDDTVHADVVPAGGGEGYSNDQVTPDVTHKVRIRYRAGTTPERRFLMPRTKTALNGALDDSTTTVVVDADLGVSASTEFRVKVDSELMIVTAGHGTNSWTVTRGADGTTAASHLDNAEVRHMAVLDIESVVNEGERDRYMLIDCREAV